VTGYRRREGHQRKKKQPAKSYQRPHSLGKQVQRFHVTSKNHLQGGRWWELVFRERRLPSKKKVYDYQTKTNPTLVEKEAKSPKKK